LGFFISILIDMEYQFLARR